VPAVCIPSPMPTPDAAPPVATSPTPGPSAPAPVPVQDLLLTAADAQETESGDWTRGGVDVKGPLLDPCAGGTAYPRDADIVDSAVTMLETRREAGGTTAVQTLARYSSAEAAADATGGYERAVRGCPGSTEPEAYETYGVATSEARGQTLTVIVRSARGCAVCYAQYFAVQQRGDLVSVLSVAYGEDGDPGVASIEPYLSLVSDKLDRG